MTERGQEAISFENCFVVFGFVEETVRFAVVWLEISANTEASHTLFVIETGMSVSLIPRKVMVGGVSFERLCMGEKSLQ